MCGTETMADNGFVTSGLSSRSQPVLMGLCQSANGLFPRDYKQKVTRQHQYKREPFRGMNDAKRRSWRL